MWNTKTPSKLTLAHALMVLAGLMTFVLVSAVLNDRSETVQVLVAASAAPVGSEASALGLQPVEIPANHPLAGQFNTQGSVHGDERITRDIAVGQPLLANDLAPAQDRVGIRTYAVQIDEVVLRGLSLRVDDRVDLIGVDERDRVYFVVTDVAVSSLSAISDGTGFSAGTGSSYVTVEVTADQALALSAALRRGDLDVLRSTGANAISAVTYESGPTGDSASSTDEALEATGADE